MSTACSRSDAIEGAFAAFDNEVVTLDPDFFEAPTALPLLDPFARLLSDWLQFVGQPEASALNMADRFPRYFLRGLIQEWREHIAEYEAIRQAVAPPFTRVAARESLRVLFIPLHRFDLSGDLEESVGRFVQDARLFSHNPLDSEDGEERLLLIFDGLDERSKQGASGVKAAGDFLDDVNRKLNAYNLRDLRVQVLISGRPPVVEQNENLLRKEGQILHVLPYFISEEKRDAYTQNPEPDDPRGPRFARGRAAARETAG